MGCIMDAEPNLWDLHHRSEADWRRVLEQRPDLAVRWICFAAERGFRAAQCVLGQMYLDGHGVACNPQTAYGWFHRAAVIGSLDARNMVGRCHELGWGVPVDHGEALSQYRRAADRGHAWAQYNVGCLLLYGEASRDHAEAFRCFTAASVSGQPDARAKALGLLGRCYEEGWGTSVDLAAAERCYVAAARAGDCWGALNLGLMQADRGQIEAAAVHLDLAIDLATPNCLAAILQTLPHDTHTVLAGVRIRASRKHSSPTAPCANVQRKSPAPSEVRTTRRGSLFLRAVLVWTLAWYRIGPKRRARHS